jgi:large subunit ribosomal protein L21
MYAIVKVGGRQYRVEKGDQLVVDRLSEDEGATVALEPLLLAGDKDPVLDPDERAKVKVEAVVRGHERGRKLRVVKFKPKRGYRRTAGHRSELTRLEVSEIRKLSRRPAGAASGSKGGGSAKSGAAAKSGTSAKSGASAKSGSSSKSSASKGSASSKSGGSSRTRSRKKEDGDGS